MLTGRRCRAGSFAPRATLDCASPARDHPSRHGGGTHLVAGGWAMWRVILRISYTSDVGSGLRNNIVPMLQDLGLQHTATGTFESAGVDRARAANHLAQ